MDEILLNNTKGFADEDRVDGLAKVTGKARFTAEHRLAGLAYGVYVTSTIARGSIRNMNLLDARNAPGVIDILYYLNAPYRDQSVLPLFDTRPFTFSWG